MMTRLTALLLMLLSAPASAQAPAPAYDADAFVVGAAQANVIFQCGVAYGYLYGARAASVPVAAPHLPALCETFYELAKQAGFEPPTGAR